MSERPFPTQFRGKTWIFFAAVMVLGSLSAFALVMGPLFLTGKMKRADGKPGTEAGTALCIIGAVLAVATSLPAFKLLALRRPLLCLCREGIVVNLIAASSMDDLPAIPGFGKALALMRAAWLVVSLQGFKQQLVYAPWETFQAAEVSGLPMQRTLTIFAIFLRPAVPAEQVRRGFDRVWFADVAFVDPLELIAQSITNYSADAGARQHLPSWHS